jgi:hypothetical protein
LPQATSAAAAIRVARTSEFFISMFLLWDELNFRKLSFGRNGRVVTRTQALESLPFNSGL